MTGWTVHAKAGRDPALVKEAFSWGALLFGPVWLAAHRAWVPASLTLAAWIGLLAVVHGPARGVGAGALMVLAGLLGRDLVRWSLERRGYTLVHVVAARDRDAALARLLAARPDMAAAMAGLAR